MENVTETKARHLAEWETLEAVLGRDHAEVKRQIELLRGHRSAAGGTGVRLAARARAITKAPSPIGAIEEIVPRMPHGFSFPEVLRLVREERSEHNFKKESIRGAFRSYMQREDCAYEIVPSNDGINRYGKRNVTPAVFPKPSRAEEGQAPYATGERVNQGASMG